MAVDSSHYTEFEIRADIDSALSAFRRMEKSYQDTISRMTGSASVFNSKAIDGFRSVQNKARSSSSAMSRSYGKSFSLMKVATATFTSVFVARMTGAFLQVGNAMLKVTSDFDRGLAEVSTLLDKNMMPAMDMFREKLIEISVTGDQSLSTLSKALYQTISAGVTRPQEAIALVKEADTAATAGLTNTETAVKGLTTVINAWGQSAGTVREVNDLLFATVKRGVTTFPELARSIGNVAAVASQTGVSTKETMAAFTSLTKAGLSTRTAMTYLKNVISALIKPSRGSAAIFKQLGIEIGENAIRQKGLIGIMEEVKEKTGGNSEMMAKLFGNIRSLQAVMVLAGDGIKNFRDDLEYMKNSTGAANEAFEKMADTWKFQSDQFKNIVSALMMNVFGPFYDSMKENFKNLNFLLKQNIGNAKKWGESLGQSFKQVLTFLIGLRENWKEIFKNLGDWWEKSWLKKIWDTSQRMTHVFGRTAADQRSVFKSIMQDGEAANKRISALRKKERVAAIESKDEIERLTKAYKNNISIRKEMDSYISDEIKKLKPGEKASGMLKEFISARDSAKSIMARAGGAKKSTRSQTTIGTKEDRSVTSFEATENRIMKLRDRYNQEIEKNAERTEKRRLELMEKYEIEKEKRRIALAKKQSDARVAIDAVISKAKRDRGSYFDIALGTDEELQAKFGKKLAILNTNVSAFRESIKSMHSADLLTHAAMWWAQFTNTGKAGAMGFVSQVNSTMSTFVTGMTDIWSGFWEKLVTGPKDASKEIVPMLLDLIGNMAAGWAAYFAAMVPGLIATYQYPQAAAAAAAALALGAVAGIAKGGASALRNANSQASSGAASGVSKAQDAFKASQQSERQQPTVINMNMGFVAPPNQRQAEYIGIMVRDSFDRSRNIGR